MELYANHIDPVSPKVSTIYPNASLLNVTKIPFDELNSDKTKPYIQYLFSTNSQLTCIKIFPHTDRFAICSSNAMHILSNDNIQSTIFFDELPTYFIRTIDIHPTEMLAVLNSDGSSVRVVSPITGLSILRYDVHSSPVTSVFFASSVKKTVSASLDGTIAIYDLEKKKVTLTFDKYKGKKSISACAMRNDESFISCSFSDGKIGLFDHRVEA